MVFRGPIHPPFLRGVLQAMVVPFQHITKDRDGINSHAGEEGRAKCPTEPHPREVEDMVLRVVAAMLDTVVVGEPCPVRLRVVEVVVDVPITLRILCPPPSIRLGDMSSTKARDIILPRLQVSEEVVTLAEVVVVVVREELSAVAVGATFPALPHRRITELKVLLLLLLLRLLPSEEE